MYTFIMDNLITILPALAIVLLAVLLFVLSRKQKALTTRMLVGGAVSIALAFALSYFKLLHMPQGGSVTPGSMLPIVMYAYSFGFFPGLVCSLAYGMLQLIQDAYVVHPMQLLLDYPLAFGALAVAALGKPLSRYIKNDAVAIPLTVLIAGLLRVCFHTLSGVIYFSEYAPVGQAPIVYSLLYNLTSVGLDTLICVLIISIPQVRRAIDRVYRGMAG